MEQATDYVFAGPNAARERQRLLAVQEEFDPDTFRRLEQLGVGPGWACLEVGCGAGSVLGWLAARVGPAGKAVGLDLDPRFVAEPLATNVAIRGGDVATTDLEKGSFDLVHARFVFIHVGQREAALANVLRALKPGGWLLLEEPDFGPAGPASENGIESRVVNTVYEATRQMYLAAGGDPFLGRRLVGWLQAHGLQVERAEAKAALWQGGSQRARLRRQAVEQLWPRLLATGAVTEAELEEFQRGAEDSAVWAFDYTTVAVWGRTRA